MSRFIYHMVSFLQQPQILFHFPNPELTVFLSSCSSPYWLQYFGAPSSFPNPNWPSAHRCFLAYRLRGCLPLHSRQRKGCITVAGRHFYHYGEIINRSRFHGYRLRFWFFLRHSGRLDSEIINSSPLPQKAIHWNRECAKGTTTRRRGRMQSSSLTKKKELCGPHQQQQWYTWLLSRRFVFVAIRK